MKTETYTLPASWASALINGDETGYTEEESFEIEEFCRDLGPCIDMGEIDEFSWHNDANNLGGAVAEFTFQILEDK